jgi:hypothetical protein
MKRLPKVLRGCVLMLAVAASGCIGAEDAESNDTEDLRSDLLGETQDELFGSPGTYWPPNGAGFIDVPVCWKFSGWNSEKATMKKAVEEEWGRFSNLRFSGWGLCSSSTPAAAVRIKYDNTQTPGVFALGKTTLDPSMLLDFAWGDLEILALHEFGHALGFPHEQDRPDNNGQCPNGVSPSTGDLLTPYDINSIMNYCGKQPPGERITKSDIMGLQEIYGLSSAPGALTRHSDGRLSTFIRNSTNNEVYVRMQASASAGASWGNWVSLGGPVSSIPATGLNTNGKLSVFVRGTDNKIYHKMQSAVNSTSYGASWTSIGGSSLSPPVVARQQDGRLTIFVRWSDQSVRYATQTSAGASTFSGWTSLGGVVSSTPAVVRDKNGKLVIFARGTDGNVWRLYQSNVNSGTYSNWSPMKDYFVTSAPSAVFESTTGKIALTARGRNLEVVVATQQTAGSDVWSSWTSLGGSVTSVPQIARNVDGRLEIFARGMDNALWHTWQLSLAGSWSPWASFGGIMYSGVAVGVNAGGHIDTIHRGSDLGVYRLYLNAGWSTFQGLGQSVAHEHVYR